MAVGERAKNIDTIVTVTNWFLAGGGERYGEHRPAKPKDPRYDSWAVHEMARTNPSADPNNDDPTSRTGKYVGRLTTYFPQYDENGAFTSVTERRHPILDVVDYDTNEGGFVPVVLDRQGAEVVAVGELGRSSDRDLASMARILGDIMAHNSTATPSGS